MVSSRFTSFLFGLIVFISLNRSFAYSHQDMEKQMVADANAFVLGGGSPLSSLQKEIFDAVPTPAEARNEEIVGRKMMKMKVLLKKEMLKEGGINVETASSSKISGANSNNHKGKRSKQNIDCTLIGDTSTSSRRRHPGHHHHHMKVRLGSFVALNADYHVPKSHPPKNN